MENLADKPARIALKQAIGGFDEACTEFIRVPGRSDKPSATTRGICAAYDAFELGDVPLAAQLMGSNVQLLAAAAERLVHVKGAPRIDLNCGCPANVVTGGGAGSSLVAAVGASAAVSVKMRSGFTDTSLFRENLLAVQEAGAHFVTVHPRTKSQSYNGRADWALIAEAKQLLSIPVIGNGDVVSVGSAFAMLQQTGCDGLMVGRGALQDPLLFHRLKQHFKAAAAADKTASLQQQRPGVSQPLPLQLLQQQQLTFIAPRESERALGLSISSSSSSSSSSNSSSSSSSSEAHVVEDFLRRYAAYGFDGKADAADSVSRSGRIGRLKKVMKYVFSTQGELRAACSELLRLQPGEVSPELLLERIIQQVHQHWQDGGVAEEVLVNHNTLSTVLTGRSKAEQTWQVVGASQAAGAGATAEAG
uniref:tRNA-dihydrouridine(47) synthase [NAD(P)(+)] n=1 Tax=Tetradesmus obliquus TaxID=3088 RepID=A0A383VKB7_TETOB|eukprot:jgi/Sobl393_1/10516/SZX65975.1